MAGAADGSDIAPGWLQKQHFTGNPLDRTVDAKRRFAGVAEPGQEVSLVVVAGREVCVRSPSGPLSPAKLQQELQALLLKSDDPELDVHSEQTSLKWRQDPDKDVAVLPLYLLGQDKSLRWTFALDVSDVKDIFLIFLQEQCQLDVHMRDLRLLLPSLSMDAVAIAGQAAALSQWHQTHKFCPRCGSPTSPTDKGMRRRCDKDSNHKQYPRTDPVVIMLVESPDGQRALLGRSKKSTPGMYTCLSGFIDQCEAIEEAVRRELAEEARVSVEDVQVVGTQPWPIGRYGSCELMLGCMARARSYEVFVNPQEIEDVQWYGRAELQEAIRAYDVPQVTLAEAQAHSMSKVGFFIPPAFAVAHHLIKLWVGRGGPWFAQPRTNSNANTAASTASANAAAGTNVTTNSNAAE